MDARGGHGNAVRFRRRRGAVRGCGADRYRRTRRAQRILCGCVYHGVADDNVRTDSAVTEDVSVTAQFAPLTFTLSYTAGTGGTIQGGTGQTVTFGGSGSAVTAVPDTGYAFTGWSDGVTDNVRTDTEVWTDIAVTARFAPVTTHTLTYAVESDGEDPGFIAGDIGQTLAPGTAGTTVTAVAYPGYTFTGWSDGVTDAARTDMADGDKTLYALNAGRTPVWENASAAAPPSLPPQA